MACMQFGALHHAFFDARPFVGPDDQRQQFQRPGPLCRPRLAEDVVRDAVVHDLALDLGQAPVHVFGTRASRRRGGQPAHEFEPGLAQRATTLAHLVPQAGLGPGLRRNSSTCAGTPAGSAASPAKGSDDWDWDCTTSVPDQRTRRSSVNGNSRLG